MVREKTQAKVVAESYVPPGTQTFVPQYSLFRDWRNFSPLPDSFVPERWLSEEDRVRLEPDIFTKVRYPILPISPSLHPCGFSFASQI